MMQSDLQVDFPPNSVTRLVQSKFRICFGLAMSEFVLDLLQAMQDQGSQAEDRGGRWDLLPLPPP